MLTNAEVIRHFDDDMLAIFIDQIQVDAAEVALGYKDNSDFGCHSASEWRDLLGATCVDSGNPPFKGFFRRS